MKVDPGGTGWAEAVCTAVTAIPASTLQNTR
jgi:hypothetical protein